MIDELTSQLTQLIGSTINYAYFLIQYCSLFVGCFIVSKACPILFQLGLQPRTAQGLPGIFFSPFLHAHPSHLFYNLIPLIIFSNLILLQGLEYFLRATLFIIVLSGIGTWIIGKPGLHIGASGLVTGYWGLLILNAYQQRSLIHLLCATLLVYFFSHVFLGIFPQKKNISWEGHLSGLIAGLITAWSLQQV